MTSSGVARRLFECPRCWPIRPTAAIDLGKRQSDDRQLTGPMSVHSRYRGSDIGVKIEAAAARQRAFTRALLAALLCCIVAVTCGASFGQGFPHKVVKLIVGHAPGGQSDVIARIIAPKLAEVWGQPVVIESRLGAAGTIAATYVSKAAADGHTLLVCSSSSLAISAVMIKDLPYDPTRDFSMIGRIATVPTVLVVGSWVPATSVAELIEYARARPGKLTAASSGPGSSSGFALEMFKAAAGIDVLQVPYNGLAPAVTGLLSGQVDMVFADFALVNPHVKAGALRLLGASGSRRILAAPDLPTLQEQGLDGVGVDSWIGIVGPAGLSSDTFTSVTNALNRVMRMSDVRQRLRDMGFDPVEDTPAQFAAAVHENIDIYSSIARRIGIGVAR